MSFNQLGIGFRVRHPASATAKAAERPCALHRPTTVISVGSWIKLCC